MKKYKVTLTKQEVDKLTSMTQKGKRNVRVLRNAFVLLSVDEGAYGNAKTDQEVAEVLHVTVRTMENIRKRFVLDGFEVALHGKPRERIYDRKMDGDAEAHLVALSCSPPPTGFYDGRCACWQTKWSSWTTWIVSHTKPSDRF